MKTLTPASDNFQALIRWNSFILMIKYYLD